MKLWKTNTVTRHTASGIEREQFATVKADTRDEAIAKVEKHLQDRGWETKDSWGREA
ncbi:hypothetical protein K388_05547 [Streptomyces sp. KhCrAH-43]|uniref:hypothetical protein n=1 Tax=unclassified Streptomyces TaxID=2593676 RepID=UPI00036B97AA|nr:MULTISPECIES: hypothetical protein [unclassified Streptomyces]MYX67393.1 hypothetical protein [Streptomyces sp. SID8373]RAJ53760.1 hypothetical protein K388_05547 [Streptomyces sp. KhCrAH-43]